MKRSLLLHCTPFLCGILVLHLSSISQADDASTATSASAGAAATEAAKAAEQYTLRYKFRQGEILRWQVVHRAKVNTTVSGTSQLAETTSSSVKVWQVTSVDSQGNTTLAHSVASIDMRQQLSGREEVHYNSQTDAQPPPGFEDAAKSVGVVLSLITLDPQGNIIRREDKHPQASATAAAQITIAMPAEPIAVGHTWSQPYDVDVAVPNGPMKKIKTRQVFKLEEVSHGIAVIRVDTQVLTPINDPAIEAQLVQRETAGTIRFDLAAGRVVGQQMDLDKHVVGFSGNASSLHYVTRFTEELLPESQSAARPPAAAAAQPSVADKPSAKPATPPTAAAPQPGVAGKPTPKPSSPPAANAARPAPQRAAPPKRTTGRQPGRVR